jgi:hypothetical protein
LRQILSFGVGAAVATLAADALLIAISDRGGAAAGFVHHVEFLGTLIALVGLAGAMGLNVPPRLSFSPRALVALGAVAAIAGFAIGVALMPTLGETGSIVAIVLAAAAVPRLAALWPRVTR